LKAALASTIALVIRWILYAAALVSIIWNMQFAGMFGDILWGMLGVFGLIGAFAIEFVWGVRETRVRRRLPGALVRLCASVVFLLALAGLSGTIWDRVAAHRLSTAEAKVDRTQLVAVYPPRGPDGYGATARIILFDRTGEVELPFGERSERWRDAAKVADIRLTMEGLYFAEITKAKEHWYHVHLIRD
jgi:hypothetical protein